jgi:hypothetical protein
VLGLRHWLSVRPLDRLLPPIRASSVIFMHEKRKTVKLILDITYTLKVYQAVKLIS